MELEEQRREEKRRQAEARGKKRREVTEFDDINEEGVLSLDGPNDGGKRKKHKKSVSGKSKKRRRMGNFMSVDVDEDQLGMGIGSGSEVESEKESSDEMEMNFVDYEYVFIELEFVVDLLYCCSLFFFLLFKCTKLHFLLMNQSFHFFVFSFKLNTRSTEKVPEKPHFESDEENEEKKNQEVLSYSLLSLFSCLKLNFFISFVFFFSF